MSTFQRLSFAIALFVALSCNSFFVLPPAKAQLGLGLGMAQSEQIRQLKDTQVAMKEYAASHDHFPNGVAEFDDCLKMLYKKVSLNAPDSSVAIKTEGKFRIFYQFAISIDYSDVPIVNGVAKVPDFINAPPNTIVINTDGGQNCWGWLAGPNGKPVCQDGSPLFFEQKITTEKVN